MATVGETLSISVLAPEATAVEVRFGGASAHAADLATADGNTWTANIDTADWEAGFHTWKAWATFPGGIVRVVESGSLAMEADVADGDQGSIARQNVSKIESMLTGNASQGVRRYRINNRELERYSVAELLQLLSYWQQRMKTEDRRAAGRSTLGPRIAFRF